MPEIRFTRPGAEAPYVVEVPDGADTAAIVASMADGGWSADVTESAATPVEVPVGDPINLTPETPADQAAPAEPDNGQPAADTTKEN